MWVGLQAGLTDPLHAGSWLDSLSVQGLQHEATLRRQLSQQTVMSSTPEDLVANGLGVWLD